MGFHRCCSTSPAAGASGTCTHIQLLWGRHILLTQPAGPRILLYSAATTLGAAGLGESICYTLLSAPSAEPTLSSPQQSHAQQGSALPPLQPAPCSTSRPLLWHIPLSGGTGGNSDIPSVMPGKGTNSKNTVPLPPAPPAPHSQHSPLSSSTL